MLTATNATDKEVATVGHMENEKLFYLRVDEMTCLRLGFFHVHFAQVGNTCTFITILFIFCLGA